ncbi:metallophosphoesterase [Microbacterium sp. NPDC055502]
MAILLHLSDLHLTGEDAPEPTADHKAGVIPAKTAGHRAQLLTSSLRGLGESLRAAGDEIDSIIITGDIADHGRLAGYEQLNEVLSGLESSLPAKSRIMIVPGNHDVDRTASGDDRFAGMRGLRADGYLVGWLSDEEIGVHPVPKLTAHDETFVIVGLNSSFFSGSQLNIEDGLEEHLAVLDKRAPKDEAIKALLAAWRRRGGADIARMSGKELQAIHDAVGPARESGPLRIAGLHHQVLPVGTAEEIKAFEGILNLGHLRYWLASNHIDLVLHGHKHDAAVIRERIDTDRAHDDHEMTILSAPSVSTARNAGDGVGQLIRVASSLPRLSGYEITTVPAAEEGAPTTLARMPRRVTPLSETTANGLISGAEINSTYAQITGVLDRLRELPTPLICRVEDGASGVNLPELTPNVPAPGTERDEWLDTVIDWWQRAIPGGGAKFNHGQFLRAEFRDQGSALTRIVKELEKKQGTTSRALAVLVNQDTLTYEKEYPSFVMLQFVLRDTRLDAIAYFRKQEMRHWWPINVVEVARIQKEVVDKIDSNIAVTCGSITTVTGMPVHSPAMPTVAVPALDLRADQHGGMLDLVVPLFQPASDREAIENLWREMFDWVPDKVPTDGDPRPLRGLHVLSETLQSAAAAYGVGATVEELVGQLDSLHYLNKNYDEPRREEWAPQARTMSAGVLGALKRFLDTRAEA